ncbi:hypothetical protein DEO72_LG8g1643 [Vigna unguiculata]|uniref:Uncharacterized protein n=1 Tax=Vigna unguiculata TaxID=3917 RepID=A0A4D6MRD9_VIGUN|nr:hypothetical protein DEO72_LG8g1643 [Vigna unguiculata]
MLTRARCSLAQKSSWSLGRPFAQKSWASSLFISPRRDWLAWARLTGLATVFLEQSHPPVHNNTSSHCTHSEHQTNQGLSVRKQNNSKNKVHEWVLASLPRNRANRSLDDTTRAPQPSERTKGLKNRRYTGQGRINTNPNCENTKESTGTHTI